MDKIVEITAPGLTDRQISILEDEFDQVFKMDEKAVESLRKLQSDAAFRAVTGLPAPK